MKNVIFTDDLPDNRNLSNTATAMTAHEQIIFTIDCDIITTQTNKCTQFYENYNNITKHQILHGLGQRAQQAKQVYHFKNIVKNWYKSNTSIRYNKTCRQLQLEFQHSGACRKQKC